MAIGAGELVLIVVILTITLGGMGLWIWMMVDCLTNEPATGNDRLVWILVIVLGGWIGALVYLLVRRPRRLKGSSGSS